MKTIWKMILFTAPWGVLQFLSSKVSIALCPGKKLHYQNKPIILQGTDYRITVGARFWC